MNRRLITKILLEEFYLFFPNTSRQIKFLVTLQKDELAQFLTLQSSGVVSGARESITYEITKKDHLYQKYEINKCEFGEAFKNKSVKHNHSQEYD